MTLKRLHRWAGLLLTLPLLVQGITGGILAAAPLLDALTATRIDRPANHRDDIGAIIALAQEVAPGLALRRYRAPADEAVILDLAGPQASPVQILVDPVLLHVVAVREAPDRVLGWVHGLHENLLLQAYSGRSVIGWIGVGLLFLSISGLFLWWPRPGRWRQALTVSRTSRGWLLQRQLHGVAGAGLAVMLVVQSASGITLGFPQTARAVFGLPPAFGRGAPTEHVTPVAPALLAARAEAAVPGSTLAELRLPNGARPAMALLRGPEAAVQMAADGRVLWVRDPRADGALGWLRTLHYGEAFGLLWRVLLVLGGFALPLLPVTGMLLWLRRRRAIRSKQGEGLRPLDPRQTRGLDVIPK